ncbi:phosphate signaling complex protein PhoU [Paenibacillus phoenicis]|uniref:Phosphate-specific transport system accessory protein PhoU n=2 Tax=Paenibacillus TaxID=44249 RepID=A0ABW3S7M3_9BACL|nr:MULTISPECIES: phosphate signaling complex protein PhoU [Paenibacillus]MCH1638822.1 phosphate signaling complex protein PhoU [Paenibacillus timonensis]MEA3570677.1 phosphate signaling complex protein PhoU [Paenibacillus phoenicis]
MTRRKEFDQGLAELQTLLVTMGEQTETVLNDAIQALDQQDISSADQIIKNDLDINELEEKIMKIGTKLIATQQPVAKDLRKILVAFKISSDLERMADLAVDIAEVVLQMEEQKLMQVSRADILRLGEITKKMIHDSIQAYLHENVDLAYKMARDDDQVDHLYSQIIRELVSYIVEKPYEMNQILMLAFVCRYIERIADHATNIGENVVFLVNGHRPELNP